MAPPLAEASTSRQVQRLSLRRLLAKGREVIINGKYKFLEKIEEGSFGVVCKGVQLDNGKEVAIKFGKEAPGKTSLYLESEILKKLGKNHQYPVPKFKWFGVYEGYNVLVMELLGACVAELLDDNHLGGFSIKTTLLLGLQLINRLADVHKIGYIHADLKPDNLCMGLGEMSDKVYLIDYGLARKYMDKENGRHISYCANGGFFGNERFCSYNACLGREQSRRDDMEAVAYIMIYFLKGSLPWDRAFFEGQSREVVEIRNAISPKQLCKGLPKELLTYLEYVKKLGFDEMPNYIYLRELLLEVLVRNKSLGDMKFDWEPASDAETDVVAPATQEKGRKKQRRF